MTKDELAAVEAFRADNETFTVKGAAAALGVSVRTVMAMLADGRLHGVKLGGKWRFSKAELEKILHGDV